MFFGKDLSKIAELAAQSSETRLQRLTAEWIAREIKAAQQSVHATDETDMTKSIYNIVRGFLSTDKELSDKQQDALFLFADWLFEQELEIVEKDEKLKEDESV